MIQKLLYFMKSLALRSFIKPISPVNRSEIIEHMRIDGCITPRFIFMVIMSCAVATLGLLQSSPSVIIGAMLISPLMTPIMALGFGLCIMDSKIIFKSLFALLIGTFLALSISFILVKFSPLNDPTPEILARTSPNLLDLAIAVFSALAGGYSIINRKGETLVGVAIATALMPPLAVVGFGLAVGKMSIVSGSFFLFMTNLIAIALSVTVIAACYGFGSLQWKHYHRWQVAMVSVVFCILSIPLGTSLKHIAYETMATRTAKNIIREYFATNDLPGRIELFHITLDKNYESHINSVILTNKYHPEAQKEILARLQDALDYKVMLALDQVVTNQNMEPKNVVSTVQSPVNSLSYPQKSEENRLLSKIADSLS